MHILTQQLWTPLFWRGKAWETLNLYQDLDQFSNNAPALLNPDPVNFLYDTRAPVGYNNLRQTSTNFHKEMVLVGV